MKERTENADTVVEGPKKRFRLQIIITIVSLIVVGAVFLVLILMPYGIEYGVEHWLENQGVREADIEDIDFNPFLGTIELLTFQSKGSYGAELNMAKATLRFNWSGLLKHRLDVKEIILEDGVIDVQHHDKSGWLFGILPFQPIPETADAGNDKQKNQTPWGLGAEKLRLKNIMIRFQDASLKEDIIISEAHVDHVNTWQRNEPGTIYLFVKKEEGTLAFKGKFRFAWNEKEKKFSIETGGDIQGSKILFQGEEFRYDIAGFHSRVHSRLTVFKANAEDSYEFSVDGSATIENIQVHDLQKNLNMATIERLIFDSFQMQQDTFTLNTLKLSGVKLFQKLPDKEMESKKDEYAASFHEMLVEKVGYGTEKGIEVADIQLKDAEWSLVRNRKGKLEVSEWLAPPQKKKAGDTKVPSTVHIHIGQSRITGESFIRYEDHSLKTAYKETVGPFSLKVGKLDTMQKEILTPIDLQTKIGKYSSWAIAGTFLPFGEKLTLDLQGTLSALDFPSLNPYFVEYFDYRFDSGHADADIKWRIDKDELDSEINLIIKKIKYMQLKEGGEDRFKQVTGMPLNYVANLLRDKENNIRLRLFVKGDIRKPDFKYSDAFRQAILAGIKKTVVSYYTPLGVTLLTGVSLPVGSIYVSGKLIKWVTTLRFKSIEFERENIQLAPTGKEYLDTLAKLLLDRPKVSIVLCGKAVPAELDYKTKKAMPNETLSDKERAYLLELARNRATEVKEYLILKNVPSDRLLICEPVIDDLAEAKPGVDISL